MKTANIACFAVVIALGCGGAAKTEPTAKPADTGAAGDEYAPLEHGADYAEWTKMNTESFSSRTHGGRFVDVYVNDVGVAAFKADGAPFPEGSIIVKTSWETADGQATDVAGPIFVMKKLPAGTDASTNDWWYALHWEQVPPAWQSKMGGKTEVYWRSPSSKVGYCVKCHDNYDREIGGVPEGKRAWETPESDSAE